MRAGLSCHDAAVTELPGAERRHLGGLPVWTPWALLTASAAALLLVVALALRNLIGAGPPFLSETTDGLDPYTRVAYVLQVVSPDRLLVLPLLALTAAGFLHRRATGPRPVLAGRVAVALTGLLALEAAGVAAMTVYAYAAAPPADGTVTFYGPDAEIEGLAPPFAGAVLLLCLALTLLRVLLDAGVVDPAEADSAEMDPADVDPAAVGSAAVGAAVTAGGPTTAAAAGEGDVAESSGLFDRPPAQGQPALVAEPATDRPDVPWPADKGTEPARPRVPDRADRHAAYRRPDARQQHIDVPEGQDPHSAYRRPSGP